MTQPPTIIGLKGYQKSTKWAFIQQRLSAYLPWLSDQSIMDPWQVLPIQQFTIHPIQKWAPESGYHMHTASHYIYNVVCRLSCWTGFHAGPFLNIQVNTLFLGCHQNVMEIRLRYKTDLFTDSSKIWFWNRSDFLQKICKRPTIHVFQDYRYSTVLVKRVVTDNNIRAL